MWSLRGWMYGVGALYLVLAVLSTPPMMGYPLKAFGAVFEPGAREVILDVGLFIGSVVAVLGVFLLRGAKEPHLNRELVKLVIWLELIAGVLLSVYMGIRGYAHPVALSLWALLHAGIAFTGRQALSRFKRHLTVVRPIRRAS